MRYPPLALPSTAVAPRSVPASVDSRSSRDNAQALLSNSPLVRLTSAPARSNSLPLVMGSPVEESRKEKGLRLLGEDRPVERERAVREEPRQEVFGEGLLGARRDEGAGAVGREGRRYFSYDADDEGEQDKWERRHRTGSARRDSPRRGAISSRWGEEPVMMGTSRTEARTEHDLRTKTDTTRTLLSLAHNPILTVKEQRVQEMCKKLQDESIVLKTVDGGWETTHRAPFIKVEMRWLVNFGDFSPDEKDGLIRSIRADFGRVLNMDPAAFTVSLRPGSLVAAVVFADGTEGATGTRGGTGSTDGSTDFQKVPIPVISVIGATAKSCVEELQEMGTWERRIKKAGLAWEALGGMVKGTARAAYARTDRENGTPLEKLQKFRENIRADLAITGEVEASLSKEILLDQRVEPDKSPSISAALAAFISRYKEKFEYLMEIRRETGNPTWRIDEAANGQTERGEMLRSLKYETNIPAWIVDKIDDYFCDHDLAERSQGMGMFLERLSKVAEMVQNKRKQRKDRERPVNAGGPPQGVRTIAHQEKGGGQQQHLRGVQQMTGGGREKKPTDKACGGKGHFKRHCAEFIRAAPADVKSYGPHDGCPKCGGYHFVWSKDGGKTYECPNDLVDGECPDSMPCSMIYYKRDPAGAMSNGGTAVRSAAKVSGANTQPLGSKKVKNVTIIEEVEEEDDTYHNIQPPDDDEDEEPPDIDAGLQVRTVRVRSGVAKVKTATPTNPVPSGFRGQLRIAGKDDKDGGEKYWVLFDSGCEPGNLMCTKLHDNLVKTVPKEVRKARPLREPITCEGADGGTFVIKDYAYVRFTFDDASADRSLQAWAVVLLHGGDGAKATAAEPIIIGEPDMTRWGILPRQTITLRGNGETVEIPRGRSDGGAGLGVRAVIAARGWARVPVKMGQPDVKEESVYMVRGGDMMDGVRVMPGVVEGHQLLSGEPLE